MEFHSPSTARGEAFIRKSLSDYILFQNFEISPLDRSSHPQLFKIYVNRQFNSGPEHAENFKIGVKKFQIQCVNIIH